MKPFNFLTVYYYVFLHLSSPLTADNTPHFCCAGFLLRIHPHFSYLQRRLNECILRWSIQLAYMADRSFDRFARNVFVYLLRKCENRIRAVHWPHWCTSVNRYNSLCELPWNFRRSHTRNAADVCVAVVVDIMEVTHITPLLFAVHFRNGDFDDLPRPKS